MESKAAISKDTIVALATPRGRGALAIVRLSGDQAIEIAAALTIQPDEVRRFESHRLHLVEIVSADGRLLDRALGAVFRAPNSYTGEDAVEFYLHGSGFVIAQTIERCCALGARIAKPGEFTQRAFLNGRMDLAQAEAVADLIAASSQSAHRAAIEQQEGALSRRIRSLRDTLLEVCSLVELQIDFSDQDLPVLQPERVKEILDEAIGDLQALADSYSRGRLLREGAVVVIAGAANVGKSTLFNALIGEDKAIVDAAPGTTRDAVEALVEWDGLMIRLVDTAGQAAELSGADGRAVEKARITTRSADLILWVLDLSAGAGMALPELRDERTILVGNKLDLTNGKLLLDPSILSVSALHGRGIKEIREAALKRLLHEISGDIAEGLLTRERHFEAVQRGLGSLRRALEAARLGRGEELLAADLRETINHLGEIIGEIAPDDILNRIFADFCIGK